MAVSDSSDMGIVPILRVAPSIIATAGGGFEPPVVDSLQAQWNRDAIKVSSSKWWVRGELLLATNAETITVGWARFCRTELARGRGAGSTRLAFAVRRTVASLAPPFRALPMPRRTR